MFDSNESKVDDSSYINTEKHLDSYWEGGDFSLRPGM